MAKILLLNGPNLNLLGKREPGHYGQETLAQIETGLREQATNAGHELECFQSNAEHQILDKIHQAAERKTAFILINPAALTHTSIALRDALLGVDIPFIEIHLSNVHAREKFRQQSFLSDVAAGVISGLGAQGYEFALAAAISRLDT